MKKLLTIVLFIGFVIQSLFSQPSKTANDQVIPYKGKSFFGVNMGWYQGWQDKNLAEIAAGLPSKNIKGIGANTLRPTLPNGFLEQWGYNVRVNDFQYYKSLGLTDLTVFIETPSDANRSKEKFCGNNQSFLFAGMYEPIWDGGLAGTPVNEKNTFALYVYKTVQAYKDNVKFWEIINEPDFTYTSHGWENENAPGSWWKNNPNPCDLKNLQAPIFHYVRVLRIAYEVIKTVDPTAYVAIGGIGYPSFLDAVLRNTDNTDNGKITSAYPLKGGAYFDVLSYHVYPVYEPEMRNNNNSDGAIAAMLGKKKAFEEVLTKYGYNGSTFPSKEWIITETNVGRKTIGSEYGNNEMQRNYIVKSAVMAQANNIKQLHYFVIGDSKALDVANNSYDIMGMYQPLANTAVYSQKINDMGVACKSASDILIGASYDSELTKLLAIGNDMSGAAFRRLDGKAVYALWAKCKADKSETASFTYNLPSFLLGKKYTRYNWDFSINGSTQEFSATSINLTGAPVFLLGDAPNALDRAIDINSYVSIFPNPYDGNNLHIHINQAINQELSLTISDLMGKTVYNHFVTLNQNNEYATAELVLPNIAKGSYLLKGTTGDRSFCKLLHIP
jgi:hypothetical protein